MKLLENETGRKKKYTEELANRLLDALACGRTLVSMRDFGDVIIEDEVLEIVDAEHISEEQIIEKTGKKITIKKRRFDNVARSRLRMEARLKIVARRKGGLQNRKIEIEDDGKGIDLSDAMKGMSMDDLMRFAGLSDDPDSN